MSDTRGKMWFSMFDGTGFFHQLLVYGKHRNRMVVISQRGLEASNVALMGFKHAPAYAQRFMDKIFCKYRHFVRVYIDDIVVFSDSFEEHLEHLKIVLGILAKWRVIVAARKSFIGYPSIQLLGFLVNGEGIANTPNRLKALQIIEFPTNLSLLETFIGMAGYVRNGILWFDVRIRPLQLRKIALLQNAKAEARLSTGLSKPTRKKLAAKLAFEPTEEEILAFEQLKSFLSERFTL